VTVRLEGTGAAGKERKGVRVSWYCAPLFVKRLVAAAKDAAPALVLVYVTLTSTAPQHSWGPSYTRHCP
jgi:hypothetical protein